MTRALFDISALLALFDSAHIHHRFAMAWWSNERDCGWASCPLTQNGFLRIVSQKSYPRPVPVADALRVLSAQIEATDHEFWPDSVSVVDEIRIDRSRLLGPKQITDIYLLALAVEFQGRLVTFDASISVEAVRGAVPENLVVLGRA